LIEGKLFFMENKVFLKVGILISEEGIEMWIECKDVLVEGTVILAVGTLVLVVGKEIGVHIGQCFLYLSQTCLKQKGENHKHQKTNLKPNYRQAS